ncbi:uncharacterized protein LOC124156708 [Ischnura elegans]|uniref:uncharacterized protein LOC124156708 n=1 Tax=Ischnura elegans TaxID=197161 RepID=UPI001ED8B6DC|nr:uncharacterized protein LOC124156708 [Ischnura elegans]XP_046387280.1 uncharacterized protein LOC124156708 [Ischnura elegans]XP_046387281.1 uncharacterized protein LOC124156708 [Ischnura elegans]
MELTFDVSVTPKWKKKVVVDPSPILLLERFKGSPSLLFKDLKVGQTCVKGLWIRNSNDCTVTVCLMRLPPPERGLTFSDTEFNLDSQESKRVGVTWLPTCAGTWRDVIQVQVWGLPPPHLNYRVVIHMSSVEPKPKHKCCHVNPPLRAQNSRSNMAAGAKKPGSVPGACATCCKRNVVKIPPKSGATTGSGATRVKGGKENASKIPLKLSRQTAGIAPTQHSTPLRRSSSAMDEDSLEEDRGCIPDDESTMHSEQFISMVDGGLLPSCNVPSTPIRRTTYRIQGNGLIEQPSMLRSPKTPANADTYLVLEEEEEPKVQPQIWRFKELVKELELSPLTKASDKCHKKSSHQSPVERLGHENVTLDGGLMLSQSSPIHSSAAMTPVHRPPLCSPILPHYPPPPILSNLSSAWGASSAVGFTECHHQDSKVDVAAINHSYTRVQSTCMFEYQCSTEVLPTTQVSSYDNSMVQSRFNEEQARRVVVEMKVDPVIMNRAACVIQRNWRYFVARRRARSWRSERIVEINNAASVIQRNWRHAIAKRQARMWRSERVAEMNKAACMIQRNWRYFVARRRARTWRSERIVEINNAASVIQRNWRHAIAKRQARMWRSERVAEMNKAACVIQRNWRYFVARRQARTWRSERIVEINNAASVIQRNWRHAIAKRQARTWRSERVAEVNKAAIIFQKIWRRKLALRLASKLRAERLEARNKAASVVQRSWRYFIATRNARLMRVERIAAINAAATIIQKNWRRLSAMRTASKLRAERLEKMNRAACVLQKYARRFLAIRLLGRLQADRLEAMNVAACTIQKNWRVVLAKRKAEQLREARREEMNAAACVIQKHWRRVQSQRLAAALRAERANDYSALRQEFAEKVCGKFQLEMPTFDLMYRLASSLPPEQDISHAFKYIQNGLRTKMLPNLSLLLSNKATQTGIETNKQFSKPKAAPGTTLRRRTLNEKHEVPKTSTGVRRCLTQNQRYSLGHMLPSQRKLLQKEVPETIRWSSVAEAVGCTPRK